MASDKTNELELKLETKSSTMTNKLKLPKMSEKTKVKMNDTVKEWTRVSKIHGVDRLVISHSLLLKLVWLFFLIALTAIALYLVSKTIMEYTRYEVKSRIREVYKQDMEFPTVTLCNSNPLATPDAIEYIRSKLNSKYNVTVENYQDYYAYVKSGVISSTEIDYLFYEMSNPRFNKTLLQSFGHPFLSCKYSSHDCVIDEDIFWQFDLENGYCFKFNPATYSNGTKREISKIYMPYDGLHIVMFLGNPSDDMKYLNDVVSKGLYIRIDEPENYEVLGIDAYAEPGTDSVIFVSETKSETQTKPYSECVPNESVNTPLGMLMRSREIKYTYSNCLVVCQQKLIFDKYKCQLSYLPIISEGDPICHNRTIYEAINSAEWDTSICSDWCPIECSTTHFEVSVSSTKYPSFSVYYDTINSDLPFYASLFGTENITYEMFQKSVASVRVTFKHLKYTEIVEMPTMSVVDFISSIGGTMGLFLGFSFMICVEFIELSLDFIILFIKDRRKKKQNAQNQPE